MAIHLKGNQDFIGFRLDGIWFFDPELLKLWVHADYPNQRDFFIDLDEDTSKVELEAFDPLSHLFI